MDVNTTDYLEGIARLVGDALAPGDGIHEPLLGLLVDVRVGHSVILVAMPTSKLAETGTVDIMFPSVLGQEYDTQPAGSGQCSGQYWSV